MADSEHRYFLIYASMGATHVWCASTRYLSFSVNTCSGYDSWAQTHLLPQCGTGEEHLVLMPACKPASHSDMPNSVTNVQGHAKRCSFAKAFGSDFLKSIMLEPSSIRNHAL